MKVKDNIRLEVQTVRADVFVWGLSTWTGYRWGGAAEEAEGYSPDVEWLDISTSSTDISFEVGGRNGNGVGSTLTAGYLEATVRDANLDPNINTFMRRGTPIRLLVQVDGDWVVRFLGIISNVKTNYASKTAPTIRVTADDYVPVLANSMKAGAVAGTLTQRVNDLMTAAVMEYTVTGGTATFAALTDSRNLLQHLQLVQDTELGYVFVDKEGVLRVYGKNSLPVPLTTPLYTFQNATPSVWSEVHYGDIDATNDDLDMFNEIVVNNITVVSGEEQNTANGPYKNYTSIATYGSSRLEVTTNLASGVSTFGTGLLDKFDESSVRINAVTFNGKDRPEVAGLIEQYDPVTVILEQETSYIEQTLRVLSIRQDFDAKSNSWVVTINLIDTKED